MKKNNMIILAALPLLLIISTILGVLFKINSDIKEYDKKIYPNVTIHGTDVGDKNYEEAKKILEDKFLSELKEMTINIKAQDKYFSYPYQSISGSYDIEKALNDAFDYGKSEFFLKKYKLIKMGENKDITLDFIYDEEKLKELEENIKKDIHVEPKPATIIKSGSGFQVNDDIIGCEVDLEDLNNKLKDTFEKHENRQLEVIINEIRSPKTGETLRRITGVIGSFETSYASSSYVRGENIEIVTSKINGTLLMPGEEFSYGEFAKKGIGQYGSAPGYVNGQVVNVEGGGICQPCTTLYRAVMRANIRSKERHPHMFTVGYATPGLDATVGGWGALDYKFVNTYDFPIYIEGYTEDRSVYFNIYGDPSVLKGNTYELVSNVYGLTASSYQVTYNSNGQEVNREFIAEDTYSSH